MSKLHILTRYDQMGASSRLRFFNYGSRLKADGYEVQYQSLLPDKYLTELYLGRGRSKLLLLKSYLKRFLFLLFSTKNYDIVWVEKELFPGLPTFIEIFFMKKFKIMVLDYDDSVHLNYKNAGCLKERKLERLMGRASKVFAGSPFLQEVALEAGALSVVRVPTAVEPRKDKEFKHSPLCIGWIGSPASETYLLDLYDTISSLSDHTQIQWLFLGVKNPVWKSFNNVETVDWSSENEEKVLERIDFGIMPLRDSDWEKGKCSYKLLLYNSWGVPALASPVGMNTEVVEDGENGFLVEQDDWATALGKLSNLTNSEYSKLSKKAFERVKENYSYDVVYGKILKSFNELLGVH